MPLDWVNKQNDVDFILAEDVNALATAIIENENQIENKQDKLIFDTAPIEGSTNPITSGGVKAELDKKADKNSTYTWDYEYAEPIDIFYNFGDTNVVMVSSETINYRCNQDVLYPDVTIRKLEFKVDSQVGLQKTTVIISCPYSLFFHEGDEILIHFDTHKMCTATVSSAWEGRIYAVGDFTNATLTDTGLIDVSKILMFNFNCVVSINAGDNVSLIKFDNGLKFLNNLSGNIDLNKYQDKLTFDETPTAESLNPVTSGGIKAELDSLKSKSIPHTIVSGYPITITDHLAGEELLSCRVYGADGGVGDLVSDGEYSGKYALPVYIRGKNLIDVSAFANIDNYFNAKEGRGGLEFFNVRFPAGTYTASVNIINTPIGSITAAYVQDNTIYPVKVIVNTIDTQGEKSVSFTMPQDWYMRLYYAGNSNNSARLSALMACIDNLQLEYGSSATEYEAYTEPSTATIYLDAPLTAEQSAEVSGLKAIDSDANTITAETTVKPSKTEVEYYQDINKVVTELKNAILSQGGNV